jgi:crotonobetainyl-CoA:carnitine CoA-transferase CaiB-like acyl-CoA transferase
LTRLDQIRVLDLSRYYAGPFACWLLAGLRAQVIKIESCRQPDPLRLEARGLYPDGEPGQKPWNRSGMINDRNRNKLGITVDLAAPEGKGIFIALVKISDIVVENFQADVMNKFGLAYPVLQEVNPAIIMISLSSQGLRGPESNCRSFGANLEQLGGLLSITGYPDEPPYISSLSFPDPLAGMYGAGLALTALYTRRKTGKGTHIDLSQREATTCVVGETVMDFVMNGRVQSANGNRHQFMAPHGCYKCWGDDRWVTIAIDSDEAWSNLCKLMARTDLIDHPKFADSLSRYQNQEEIDVIIGGWTQSQDHYQVQNKLLEAGIAAGAVLDASETFDNPHLKSRNSFESISHPEAGTHLYAATPLRFAKQERAAGRPAPRLGEHNYYVFGELLKMTQAQIAELERKGVIGSAPVK